MKDLEPYRCKQADIHCAQSDLNDHQDRNPQRSPLPLWIRPDLNGSPDGVGQKKGHRNCDYGVQDPEANEYMRT